MRFFIFLLLTALLIIGCSQKPNKFSDPIILKIADLQDHRQTDSLILFLLDRNPTHRTEAALALASVQDSTASPQLGTMLLEDPIMEARKAAAFALGQTNGIASVNALIPALEDNDKTVVCEVLRALGKTIGKNDFPVLRNYKATDSLSQIGQALGLYHIGLRGLADSVCVVRQAEFLKPSYPYRARLAAAHFFNRTQKVEVDGVSNVLITSAKEDKNVFIRMASANALRKIDSAKAIGPILKILANEKDYRVRVNAVRVLGNFTSRRALNGLINSLNDQNESVGIAASEVLKPSAELKDLLLLNARAAKNWRIQSNLYKTVLAFSPSEELEKEIQQLYTASQNDYQKAALLNTLSASVNSFKFVENTLLGSGAFVIKSSAAQSLSAMNQGKSYLPTMQGEFTSAYKAAILQGDPGVIGIVASALKNPSLGYKEFIKDFTFLKEAKAKLSLPKDIEALQPLEEVIAYFEGKSEPAALKNTFNHPINWALLKTIPIDQSVKIKTVKGDILLQLLVEEAPGSVANFIELVNKKYFNEKYFHRVVSNFVIQGGCNRGDGFGSEDFSIRSEFSMRSYKEGSVGMASAGKDTEGTQWFITHSPTPHLDGRYTIFAEVKNGMEVVHSIQVGDKILDIELVK